MSRVWHPSKPGLAPSIRDRLEMVPLRDAGCRVPQMAAHLRQHEQTVRFWIKHFLHTGFEGLGNKARGGKRGGKQCALTPALLEAVR